MDADQWQDVQSAGVSLRVPAGWTVVPGESTRIPVTAVGPEQDGFSPSIVLTVQEVAHDDIGRWSQATVAGLREALHTYQLLDLTAVGVDGHPAVLRLAAFAIDEHPLTSLQWAWLDHGVGRTLTATCASTGFHDLEAVFSQAARSIASEVTE